MQSFNEHFQTCIVYNIWEGVSHLRRETEKKLELSFIHMFIR